MLFTAKVFLVLFHLYCHEAKLAFLKTIFLSIIFVYSDIIQELENDGQVKNRKSFSEFLKNPLK